ncbi:MsnO8 family LLM class oxidoreductase [Rhodococcus sp. IEGM 1366]|uniref:MsnO8 family LLM class oxidoreductase n=1 Tax=Rhodococcus sp. IEGM 1366 TaxID=3082223 RepID=UPI002954787E|nr:MsnO8 family LLM class oxidoreductase [Rhodococcus sp. IEGM 1366]MDV8071378.1 MsnO8 family LLM class oxidoreductase [Rhodococcus sp. IEGM 1366]
MRVSIVDLGTVAPETGETEALADALATARHADSAGFHRIWFAEHHLSAMGASHHPELLIAAAGAQTKGIRLGSGAMLMNHYSPLKVAEMFKQLEAMYPGRIDLGMGRATAGPVIDLALQRDRRSRPVDDHDQQVLETVTWLYGAFAADHPFAARKLIPSVTSVPQTWLLGSSEKGSTLAAGLGIGYTFAGFINPIAAAHALQKYRQQFQPHNFGLKRPRAILAVNVSVGDTATDGERLTTSAKAYYARLRRGDSNALVPSTTQGARELSIGDRNEPITITDGRWPRFVGGSVQQVRATLEQMIEESGADEVMVQDMIADPRERRHSHALLADAFGLTPRCGVPDAAYQDLSL